MAKNIPFLHYWSHRFDQWAIRGQFVPCSVWTGFWRYTRVHTKQCLVLRWRISATERMLTSNLRGLQTFMIFLFIFHDASERRHLKTFWGYRRYPKRKEDPHFVGIVRCQVHPLREGHMAPCLGHWVSNRSSWKNKAFVMMNRKSVAFN